MPFLTVNYVPTLSVSVILYFSLSTIYGSRMNLFVEILIKSTVFIAKLCRVGDVRLFHASRVARSRRVHSPLELYGWRSVVDIFIGTRTRGAQAQAQQEDNIFSLLEIKGQQNQINKKKRKQNTKK